MNKKDFDRILDLSDIKVLAENEISSDDNSTHEFNPLDELTTTTSLQEYGDVLLKATTEMINTALSLFTERKFIKKYGEDWRNSLAKAYDFSHLIEKEKSYNKIRTDELLASKLRRKNDLSRLGTARSVSNEPGKETL